MTELTIVQARSPSRYFLLVFALSVPFWALGALTDIQLLPGLPIAGLGAFCPAIAALILVAGEHGPAGMAALLKRAFDVRRIRTIWYAPTVLLMPCVLVLSYALLRLSGSPLPALQFPVLSALFMFVAFFAAALGEELGWTGYATDPLQARLPALNAALLLGLIWAVWHIVPLIQAHRAPVWIAWWSLGTVSTRVLMVWLYNNTGDSVFAVALFHAISNLSVFLIPGFAAAYDPRITGTLLAVAAVTVTIVWGARRLVWSD